MKWKIPPPPIQGATVVKSYFLWTPRGIGDYMFWLCFMYQVYEYNPHINTGMWAWRCVLTTTSKREAEQYGMKSKPLIEGNTKSNVKTPSQYIGLTASPPPAGGQK